MKFFHDHLASEDRLAQRLGNFEIVIGMRERTAFRRSLLTRLPELQLLITTGRANPSFDIATATELGVIVSGTRTSGEGPTEMTWGLILCLFKNLLQEDRATRQGQWGISLGMGLKGKTLGLLGLGHIGSLVARVGNAFDMGVIAWSQNLTPERVAECQATLVNKDALFRESDVLSIHVRLSNRTRGLVTARELGLMKKTAYFINTARGPIVDEAALIGALQRGTIAGAGLEVFDEEPLPNTLLTPHSAYVTDDCYGTYFTDVVENINAFLSGKPIRVLNPRFWNLVSWESR